jgi:hypothetical protein
MALPDQENAARREGFEEGGQRGELGTGVVQSRHQFGARIEPPAILSPEPLETGQHTAKAQLAYWTVEPSPRRRVHRVHLHHHPVRGHEPGPDLGPPEQ